MTIAFNHLPDIAKAQILHFRPDLGFREKDKVEGEKEKEEDAKRIQREQ